MPSSKPSSSKSPGKATPPSLTRSSAAEYLTFIAANGEQGVNAIYADESIWLTQKMLGELYGVETNTINYHLKKILFSQPQAFHTLVLNLY